MRARLAICASRAKIELREIVLRDKPAEMLEASPKGTVPVLLLPDGRVLEESLDVMKWALGEGDPEGWLDLTEMQLEDLSHLISSLDGPFKSALDTYKYEFRFNGEIARGHRDLAMPFLEMLNEKLGIRPNLFGDRFSFADAACLPFIRQFAHVDEEWFRAQDWPHLVRWLDRFLNSGRFAAIMEKYPRWQKGEDGIIFGG